MIRTLLAALALACALSSPALALAPVNATTLPSGLAWGALALLGIGLTIVCGTLWAISHPTAPLRRVWPWAGLACLVLIAGPALAAEVVVAPTPAPAVVLPYGDWIVAIGQTLSAILVPALAAVATAALARVAPWAALFLSQRRIEAMIQSVTDYALNAVDGAAKGQALTVPVGSAVIAQAVQRAIDAAPAYVRRAAGGPVGIAERVFRALHLEPGATAATVLAPALDAIRAQAAR